MQKTFSKLRLGRGVLVIAVVTSLAACSAASSTGESPIITTKNSSGSLVANTTPSVGSDPTIADGFTRPGSIPPATTAAAVATARRSWAERAPRHYQWTLHRSYFAEEPTLRVTVDGENVIAVDVLASGPGYPAGAAKEDAMTVPALFDRIQLALQQGEDVRASFDPLLGYPVDVVVSSRLPDGGDGFFTVELHAL